MKLYEKIEEVLEHYNYALVTVKGHDSDNVIVVAFPTTNAIMFRDFTIAFGSDRVSKHKGMVRIDEKA